MEIINTTLINKFKKRSKSLITEIDKDNLTYKSLTYFGKASEKSSSFLMKQVIQITFKSMNYLEKLIKQKWIRTINQDIINLTEILVLKFVLVTLVDPHKIKNL